MLKQKIKMRLLALLSLWLLTSAGHPIAWAQDISSSDIESSQVSSRDDESASQANDQAESKIDLATYQAADASQQAEWVRSGKVTSEELVNFALTTIKEKDPALHAVISLRAEEALTEARQIKDQGQPFLGVPLLVKGLGHTIKGMPNSNGLTFLANQKAGSTSPFVKSLQDLGFILIGQTNYPEMGLKNITDSKLYGPTGSPWNPDHQAGGSSGGSGAATAAGMTPTATGSDAGGSIRIPASWNGLIGLKPSRGVIVGNASIDKNTVAHFMMTKTMEDTKSLFEALKKPDASLAQALTEAELKRLAIGYTSLSPVGTQVSPEAQLAVERTVAFLRGKGFRLEEVNWPFDGVQLMKDYYTINASQMGVVGYLAKTKLKRELRYDDVDPTSWLLYQASKTMTKEEVNQAWARIQQVRQTMADFHQRYPLFLTPTTAYTAPRIDQALVSDQDLELIKNSENLSHDAKMQLIYDHWLPSLALTPYTQFANLTGEPALSLPALVTKSGLPLGIQFNAAIGNDRYLLQLGDLMAANQQFNRPELETSQNEPSTLAADTSSNELFSSSENQQLIGGAEGSKQISAKLPETGDLSSVSSQVLSILFTLLGLIALSQTKIDGSNPN